MPTMTLEELKASVLAGAQTPAVVFELGDRLTDDEGDDAPEATGEDAPETTDDAAVGAGDLLTDEDDGE